MPKKKVTKKTAKKAEPKKSMTKVRNISLDAEHESGLFGLSLSLSGRLMKRVTVSDLIRIGIDHVLELDEDEVLDTLQQR